MNFQYFLRKIFPSILISLNILFNILIIIVYSRKRFKKIVARKSLRIFALSNLLMTPSFCLVYIYQIWSYDISAISSISCKLVRYIYYAFNGIHPWILVYISIERRFNVTGSPFRIKLEKMFYLICFLIAAFNLIYNCPYLIIYDLTQQTMQIPIPAFNSTM